MNTLDISAGMVRIVNKTENAVGDIHHYLPEWVHLLSVNPVGGQ